MAMMSRTAIEAAAIECEQRRRIEAAAPELLAACDEAYDYLVAAETDTYCSYCESHAPKDPDSGRVLGGVPHKEFCIVAQLRAAISKARGEG
jgi:hypothetical protein